MGGRLQNGHIWSRLPAQRLKHMFETYVYALALSRPDTVRSSAQIERSRGILIGRERGVEADPGGLRAGLLIGGRD